MIRSHLPLIEPKIYKHIIYIVKLTCLLLFFIVPPDFSLAIMPPETYAQASRESLIKAIATIIDIQLIKIGNRSTSKNVTFKLEYAITNDLPRTFIGSCFSVETFEQKANLMVGGDIYFYPLVGDQVFVTIKNDGQNITSMTPMTDELNYVIRNEPERINYGITQVYIEGKDRITSAQKIKSNPLLQGKDPELEDQVDPFSMLDNTKTEQPKQSAKGLYE